MNPNDRPTIRVRINVCFTLGGSERKTADKIREKNGEMFLEALQ